MALTPVDLYRAGNKSGPKMDHVRSANATFFTHNGNQYVKGRDKGVSTYESPSPSLGGTWWHLPRGTQYDDSLIFLVKRDQDGEDDHWQWEPDHDMPSSQFVAVLASMNGKFIIVP